jgi:hypothetical protein
VIGAKPATKFFCGICAGDVASTTPKMAPIGKNDELVIVCDDCFTEPAHEARGRDRCGYEIEEGMSMATMQAKMVKVIGPSIARRGETNKARTPGYILIRFARARPGKPPRDQREVFEQELAKKPWAREVRYLGIDQKWHLFERPDPALAKKSRTPTRNPLMGLERYRTK